MQQTAPFAVELQCPICGGQIDERRSSIACKGCSREFSVDSGIPQLFWQNDWPADKADVTLAMQSFYERSPFPNYDDFDSAEVFRQRATRGIFAKLLDEQIRYGATILEAGCGTGQLTNFLGMTWGRSVYGADACLNSLRLGEAFRRRNNIKGTKFLQMNLFRPVFPQESFDLVISNGVLHHTSDPFLGFQTLSKLVKPGGCILIGLYNKYGRLMTDFRRGLFRVFGDRLQNLDPQIRGRAAERRKQAWFMDQYRNPHESKHTYGEVLGWFKAAGFEYLNSIPKANGEAFSPDEKLFVPSNPGGEIDHFCVQFAEMLRGSADGGLFIMIGKRL
jgi:SAM-dependent methyltransferase